MAGNASSEIRMHIVGPPVTVPPNLRETGIIEEILLENKARTGPAITVRKNGCEI